MSDQKDLKHLIAGLLEADAELQALKCKIYPGRKFPGEFDREIMVFGQGGLPNDSRGLGRKSEKSVYNLAIFWSVPFFKDVSPNLLEADDMSDDIEDAIFRILITENWDNPNWSKISVPSAAIRPPTPGGTQNMHYGRIVVRIVLV